MKRILYTILTVFLILFTACGESERKRAQRLTDEFEASFLNENRSVKAVAKVRLDSARVEFLYLPKTQERLVRANRLAAENREAQKALHQPAMSGVAYEIFTKQLWDTGEEVERIRQQLLEEERRYNPRVPGWMTFHRFRGIANDGTMKLYQYILYFDPEVTAIRAVINLNDSMPVYRAWMR